MAAAARVSRAIAISVTEMPPDLSIIWPSFEARFHRRFYRRQADATEANPEFLPAAIV
jgi:hypothetical protein